jgi:hypothetical protein
MRYFLILRSKGQGLSKSFHLEVESARFQQVFQNAAWLYFAYQNNPKDRISSMGPKGGLGEAIKPQTLVLLAVLLTGLGSHKFRQFLW